ncbi:unnamed protein product [Arctia plantaginis]|uniref:Secreted protein n=1 Tax=Arctia plantaginis TaxID=874455 RepID=A0A8S1ASU6_ARCPL|nr:unnamed protein product [Arctia plantaginis]CAB3253198.1 unnamed protein product [Arctia plantaginis]
MKVSVLLILFATVYCVASVRSSRFSRPNWFPATGFTSLFVNENCNCEIFDKHFGEGWLNWLPEAMIQAERSFNGTDTGDTTTERGPGVSFDGDSCPTGRTRVGPNCLDVD